MITYELSICEKDKRYHYFQLSFTNFFFTDKNICEKKKKKKWLLNSKQWIYMSLYTGNQRNIVMN